MNLRSSFIAGAAFELGSLVLVASLALTSAVLPGVGRYQATTAVAGAGVSPFVVVIDTATGRCWGRWPDAGGPWFDLGMPGRPLAMPETPSGPTREVAR